MEQIPALAGVIAKIMVLLDRALGVFATVDVEPISEGCSIMRYTVNVTTEGEALTDTLAQLLFSYAAYLSEYFTALMTGVSA